MGGTGGAFYTTFTISSSDLWAECHGWLVTCSNIQCSSDCHQRTGWAWHPCPQAPQCSWRKGWTAGAQTCSPGRHPGGSWWWLTSSLQSHSTASMLIWLSFIHWSLAVASTQEQHMSDAIRPPPADPANWHSCLIITALNSHHFTSMARNWLTFVALRPGEECAGELLSPVIILIKICMSGQCWCEEIMGKIWMSHSLGYIIMGWGQSITI